MKKRDFTSANLDNINEYLSAIPGDFIWDYVISFFSKGLIPTIKSFFKNLIASIVSLIIGYDEPSDLELIVYYRHVMEKNDELKYKLKYIFEKANNEDKIYANRAELLLKSGDDILKELNYLIGVASPDKIAGIVNTTAPEIVISSILGMESAISDEDLENFCKNGGSNYINVVSDSNSALLEISGIDIFLVLLFKGKDIAIETIVAKLNASGGLYAKKWISQQILNGSEGFISVSEIAARVGCSEEVVRKYLESGTITDIGNTDGLLSGKTGEYNNAFINDVNIKNGIDQILAEHVQMVYSDEALLQKYCNEAGIDLERYKAMKSDGYSVYEENLYYENIGKILESACGSAEYKKNFDLKLSKTKEILGIIKDGKGIWEETTEEGKLLKKMWENKILSDAEARKFLKNCCGYDSVSASDIELFRGLTENINSLGGVTKWMGKTQKALDAVAYLTADFSQEIEMLDSVIENASSNPSYEAALRHLRQKYTNTFQTAFEGAVVKLEENTIEKGVDAVLDTIPGIGLAKMAIEFAGEVTGADDYTDAVVNLMAYPEVTKNMLDAYNNSVIAVAEGRGSVNNVRLNFTALKQALSDCFDKSADYYSKKDPRRLAYAEYMKGKVDDMELGKAFEYLSFDEYIVKYSI